MRVPTVLLTAALAVAISGCAAQPDVAPGTLIGKSITEVDGLIPSGSSFAWYDLSEQVLHQPGTLIGGEDPDGEGVIIAVCADADTIGNSTKVTAGVIPQKNYQGSIKRRAEAGEYQTQLPECASK